MSNRAERGSSLLSSSPESPPTVKSGPVAFRGGSGDRMNLLLRVEGDEKEAVLY